MDRDLRALEARLPFGQSQVVVVTFPGTADLDTPVKHTLPAGRYREVHYFPLRLSEATTIYTGDHLPEPGVLWLRSTVASATVTLLVFLLKDADV
jgi:hypothetical protein